MGGESQVGEDERRSCCVGGDAWIPGDHFFAETMVALDFLIPTHLPSLWTTLPPISGASRAAEAKGRVNLPSRLRLFCHYITAYFGEGDVTRVRRLQCGVSHSKLAPDWAIRLR